MGQATVNDASALTCNVDVLVELDDIDPRRRTRRTGTTSTCASSIAPRVVSLEPSCRSRP